MDKFAFIIHAMDVQDIREHMSFLRFLPSSWVEFLASRVSPFILSHVTGVKSAATGKEIEGWFVGLPMTSRVLVEYPFSFVARQIRKCALLAEKMGAGIIGLGAFTSVAGDGGITVKKGLRIAVTTGNSYTVATALEALKVACGKMDVDLSHEEIAIVGATGSIGRACALVLAEEGKKLRLVGRDRERTEKVKIEAEKHGAASVKAFVDIQEGIQGARAILTVASAVKNLLEPSWIERGAVICDVARPRNVAEEVARAREDVLVIEGGVVDVPGDPDFGMDFGYPPRKAYACMAETMILTLEGRFEDYTLGKEVEVERVKEIQLLAEKHGFRVSGLRSFGRELTEEEIEEVKKKR
ncbi:MAG: shikimate dehydrogenase [Candidatus Atribacteria bacterium]|nr:shikimate dehydrogenase [Candidatus Atribacteria bacterium]